MTDQMFTGRYRTGWLARYIKTLNVGLLYLIMPLCLSKGNWPAPRLARPFPKIANCDLMDVLERQLRLDAFDRV